MSLTLYVIAKLCVIVIASQCVLPCFSTEQTPRPIVHIVDRQSHAEARTLAFVAEHNMKLDHVPDLVEYAKEMVRDHRALDQMSMGQTSATYKMTHGLGYVTKKRLVHDMQTYPFSLNVDECTSNNHLKVFSVMVAYFSPEREETIVQHYNSVSLSIVNAQVLRSTLLSMLESDNIPLVNLVSILSDSANYMRGKKSGFETLMRKEATHLLDIDGDVCHHIHNGCKKFCGHFGGVVEKLADDWHTDFKYSTDLREYLQEICTILQCAYHIPKQRIPHR